MTEQEQAIAKVIAEQLWIETGCPTPGLKQIHKAVRWMADGCPDYPCYGMGGGSSMEMRAQDDWTRKYGDLSAYFAAAREAEHKTMKATAPIP